MNAEQAEVVAHDDGPLAVFAGAGSGKTRVLCHRIGRLVDAGVAPERILAVTFSKKAADEMNERLAALDVHGARVGTWHSLAWQILREDTRYAKWEIDAKDKHKVVVKKAAGYQFVNWDGCDVSAIRSMIGICAANLWTPESDEGRRLAHQTFGDDGSKALQVWRTTEMLLEEASLLTFDNMLVALHEHLSDEENRARWAGRWDYLLQDEAQDANAAQVAIAELLARDHRNYMIVGDPAQSIYDFRGSSPRYLREFADSWKARVVTMHRNYRSAACIVQAANGAIRAASVRLPVDLEAQRTALGVVRVVSAETMDEEAREFALHVQQARADGSRLADFTGLFRTNAQTRALEEAFLATRIPYTIVGGGVFYERREVKDLLGYLRVIANRDPDGDALKRCINAPFRYLGARFVDKVMEEAHARGDGLWSDVVRSAARVAGIQRRQVSSAESWAGLVDLAHERLARGARPTEIIDQVLRTTGYIEWLEKDEGEESIESSHAANVREMRRVSERFATVGELLDFIDESIRESLRERSGKGDRVLLMSVHRAKGLEWPRVWVIGCNEKILPHAKGNPEEERRIFYVAATRARDELTLSYVHTLTMRSGPTQVEPSRFLFDAGLLTHGRAA